MPGHEGDKGLETKISHTAIIFIPHFSTPPTDLFNSKDWLLAFEYGNE